MGQVALFGADNTAQLLQTAVVTSDGQDLTSGRRSRNFIRNRSGYRNTNGWAVVGACTVTRTTTAAEIVDGVASLRFGAGAASDYIRNAFIINNIQKAQPLNISFDFIAQSGVAGDWDVTIFDVTAATTIVVSAPSQGGSGGNLSAGTGTFNAFFIASINTSYELRIVRKGGTGTFSAANFDVFQQQVRVGAAVTEFVSFSPSYSTGTPGTNTTTAQWARAGDSMAIQFNLAQTAVGTTGSGTYNITVPNGQSIDLTKHPLQSVLGNAYGFNGTSEYTGYAVVVSSTQVAVYFFSTINALTAWGNTLIPFGNTIATVRFNARFAISNWSSNTQMADRSLEEYSFNTSTTAAADSTSFGYGSGGVLFQAFAPAGMNSVAKDCRFQTPIQATDYLICEVDGGNGRWQPFEQRLNSYFTNDAGTTAVGIKLQVLNSTDVRVLFFSAIDPTSLWSAISTWRWRVRKVSSGAQIGGAISSSNIVGRVDGSVVGSGYVGETIEAIASANYTTTTSFVNVPGLSIALTRGLWQITYAISVEVDTGTAVGNNSFIRIVVADASLAVVPKSKKILLALTPAAVSLISISTLSASFLLNVTTAQTYTIRAARSDGAGTGVAYVLNDSNNDSTIIATRIA